MNCMYLTKRTKNYKPYFFCRLNKQQITLVECKNCLRLKYKENKPTKGRKHKQTKATEIPKKVKEKVWKRDNRCCIICGKLGSPNSHYISRAKGGLGIERNIVTMCINCHNAYDNGYDEKFKENIRAQTKSYLKNKYKNWNEEDLIYSKWKKFGKI